MKRRVEGKRLSYYKDGDNRDFWENHWRTRVTDGFYERARHGSLGALEDTLIRYLPTDGRILEAGCGPGQHVLALQKRGYLVEGVEYEPETVRSVREIVPDLPIRVGDVSNLDVPDNHYGGYISLGVIEHRYEGPEPFLSEAYRILRTGGIALFSVPYFHSLRRLKARLSMYQASCDGSEFYQYAFREREFLELLAISGFRVVESFAYGCDKGIGDEIPLCKWMFRKWGIGHVTTRLLTRCSATENLFGHMLVVVAEKGQSQGV